MHTVFITGGNSGMGFQTARDLAMKGWNVWIGCRTESKGMAAVREINRLRKEAGKPANANFEVLDLSSFTSVRSCAKMLEKKLPQLDVLICNAGVMSTPYQITEDGFELQFQVNYLGHFLLTQLLQGLLEASADPRVINISSLLGEKGQIADLAALQRMATVSASAYNGMKSYRESKFAQMLNTVEYQRKEGPGGIRFAVVHPGVVNTGLFSRNADWKVRLLVSPVIWLGNLAGFIKSPRMGAETALYLATAADLKGGHFWVDKQIRELNPIAKDKAYTAALWAWSMDKVKKYLD